MAQVEKLTKREKEISKLIAVGLIEKEIAAKLFISVHTVHTHTKRIRKKLHARNTADITRSYILSLPNPMDILKAMLFLVIQLHVIIGNVDIDLRRTKPTRISQNRIVRVRKQTA